MKSFRDLKMSMFTILSQSSASIQPRASRPKFADSLIPIPRPPAAGFEYREMLTKSSGCPKPERPERPEKPLPGTVGEKFEALTCFSARAYVPKGTTCTVDHYRDEIVDNLSSALLEAH